MNNTMIISHKGLFMHIDLGYHGSFYDITILRHFQFYREWRTRFTHTDGDFWILIRDLGFKGEDMFIMHGMVFTTYLVSMI